MEFCLECPNNPSCEKCLCLIEGGLLRKKVYPPKNVTLFDKTNDTRYLGRLIAISRLGMIVETTAPIQPYSIELDGNTTIMISPIHKKNVNGLIGFDITKVQRGTENADILSKEEYELLFSSQHELINKLTDHLDNKVKDSVKEMLQTQFMKSELLDRLIVGAAFKYEKGRIRLLSGEKDPLIQEEDLRHLMNEAFKKNAPSREVVVSPDQQKYLDIHAIPLSFNTGGFLTLDISDIVAKEKALRQEQWESYRDVIFSLTQSKIELVQNEEVAHILQYYKKDSEMPIEGAAKLGELRKWVKEKVELCGITSSFKIVLAVTEAATNAIKHAKESKVEYLTNGNEVLILIRDQGQGIQTKILPKATLIKGFSTKSSLGQGFHIMTQYSDKLYIKSDRAGTIVGMVFNQKNRAM